MQIPASAVNATIQLYFANCIYYGDDYSVRHGTCDTYRLFLPDTNPLNVFGDKADFVCDGKPKIGKFAWYPTGHCQK